MGSCVYHVYGSCHSKKFADESKPALYSCQQDQVDDEKEEHDKPDDIEDVCLPDDLPFAT